MDVTMILNFETLQKITGGIDPLDRQYANAKSAIDGLNTAGHSAGLDRPHRLAMFLGQVLHESMGFKYDRELWGPTPAQRRYDTRTDLGNTADGDGFKYRGRGPIQITGKSNYRQFTAWACKIDHTAPDFVTDPDAVLTDPWEGMVAIWYWSTRNLNEHADRGDTRKVTKIINGGYNGFDDRQRWTDAASLVLLGYARDDVRGFQVSAGLAADGVMGPKTRGEMYLELSALPPLGGAQARQKGSGKGVGAVAVIGATGGALAAFWDTAIETACSVPVLNWLISSCGG